MPLQRIASLLVVLAALIPTASNGGDTGAVVGSPPMRSCDCCSSTRATSAFSTAISALAGNSVDDLDVTRVYELLELSLYRMNHPNGKQYYVAEGDILLSEDELRQYAFDYVDMRLAYAATLPREDDRKSLIKSTAIKAAITSIIVDTSQFLEARLRDKLVVNVRPDGRDDFWPDAQSPDKPRDLFDKPLKYCVLRKEFESVFGPESYKTIVADMKAITSGGRDADNKEQQGWAQICRVKFEYVPSLDSIDPSDLPSDGSPPPGVDFTVRPTLSTGFVAAAFFPEDPPERRHIVFGPSYFTIQDDGFNRAGVARHEVGHCLAFRHEHIRPEAPVGCPNEDLSSARPLGAYDPHSVMHYFCGGAGTQHLSFTDLDKRLSAQKYGQPGGAPVGAAIEPAVSDPSSTGDGSGKDRVKPTPSPSRPDAIRMNWLRKQSSRRKADTDIVTEHTILSPTEFEPETTTSLEVPAPVSVDDEPRDPTTAGSLTTAQLARAREIVDELMVRAAKGQAELEDHSSPFEAIRFNTMWSPRSFGSGTIKLDVSAAESAMLELGRMDLDAISSVYANSVSRDKTDDELVDELKALYSGLDRREEVKELTRKIAEEADELFLEAFKGIRDAANSVALVVNRYSDLIGPTARSRDTYHISRSPFTSITLARGGAHPLCPRERFFGQPRCGLGTAFVVGERLMATAGHNFDSATAMNRSFVFGHRLNDDGSTPSTAIPVSQVYHAVRIVGREYSPNGGPDWAIVEVDRPITDRKPLRIRRSDKVETGQALYVIGHPCGLPQKYVMGGSVQSNDDPVLFRCDLDTYVGNSGSPVISLPDHVIEGVLVRGSPDFEQDEMLPVGNRCWISIVYPPDPVSRRPDGTTYQMGELVTRSTHFASLIPSLADVD